VYRDKESARFCSLWKVESNRAKVSQEKEEIKSGRLKEPCREKMARRFWSFLLDAKKAQEKNKDFTL